MKLAIVSLSIVLIVGLTIGTVTAHNKNITRVPEILKAPKPPEIDIDPMNDQRYYIQEELQVCQKE